MQPLKAHMQDGRLVLDEPKDLPEGSEVEIGRHPNLSDPDCEPSDEELIGLSRRAFAGLKEAEAARVATLRSDVATARKEALARFAARPSR